MLNTLKYSTTPFESNRLWIDYSSWILPHPLVILHSNLSRRTTTFHTTSRPITWNLPVSINRGALDDSHLPLFATPAQCICKNPYVTILTLEYWLLLCTVILYSARLWALYILKYTPLLISLVVLCTQSCFVLVVVTTMLCFLPSNGCAYMSIV